MVTSIGLPLLIVNGKFQSLGSMTVEDLETFIPFLVKCSVNRAKAQLINGIPEWWSSVVQYKFPLQKPKGLSQIGYRRHLSSIVCRCYWYHDAQYLLPFCAQIANSPESVFLQNNEDNTTSIFYVHNTIHIMKFNNENKNYDKEPKKSGKVSRRCLLPTTPKKSTTIPDIYLCENCDAEFSSHTEMQKHEKECYEAGAGDDNDQSGSDSSEDIEILEHFKPPPDKTSEKNQFFNYIMLRPKNGQPPAAPSKPKKSLMENHSKRWVNADLCLHKNRNVEFSSLFGQKMLNHCAKRDVVSKKERSFSLNESYCYTGVRTGRELRDSSDFKVTYKRARKENWTHQYCFNKVQRKIRHKTLITGLDENSRTLLKKCKRLQIILTRLKLPS